MPQPSDAIGPYILLRRLGQGGFGEVWLAERRSTLIAVPVALKIPLVEGHDPEVIRREAEVWLKASGHPNVVPVLDAEAIDGRIVIASEYVSGGSLVDWLGANGGRSPDVDAAVRMIDGVLAGLGHLHSLGIVHRDLKPGNVLLQAGIPRLSDFGLSRVLSHTNLSEPLSGSPPYMAPETFSGACYPSSDLWSAGVVLYEMLTGALPYDRPDIVQLITAIRDDSPAELPRDIPDWLGAIVERLLRRSPEERYGSAEEALAAIRRGPAGLRPIAESRSASQPAAVPGTGANGWYVQLMGEMKLFHDSEGIELPTRKSAALLARLAFEPGRGFRREALMEMLWPGATLEQQRNNMSVELNRLRRRLDLPGASGKSILAGVETLRADPAYVRSDTGELNRLIQSSRRTPQPADRVTLLQRAVELYDSSFLPDYDQDWIAPARESLNRLCLEAAEKLITDLGRMADHDRAIEIARALVEQDPSKEERHGLLIFALIQAGRPCDALRHYEEMTRRWKSEYDGEPGPYARRFGEEAKRRCAAQPAVSPNAGAHNGPALPQTFVPILGRESQIAQLSTLLQDPAVRLVTLTGAGGSGKTRLSIEVAGQLTESFAGAVWFVPLADLTDRATILNSLRNILGLASVAGVETVDQITKALSTQRSLLVLDNYEHLLEREADLVDHLLERVPSLTCLVTSRQSVGSPMELLYEVPPLPVPSTGHSKQTGNLAKNVCVQLFIERAHRVRADFALTSENTPAVIEICRRLDGLPLAIELAAAWARMLTPADMLDQLRQILVSRERRVPTHHRSLDAVIGASFGRLADDAQAFMARLSVFRGGWTADAAKTVCDEPGALLMLSELQDASLILSYESGPNMRFRMLEPIREYAQDRLTTLSDAGDLRDRYSAVFLNLAKQGAGGLRGSEQADWLRRLEDDLPNLRAAFEMSRAEDQLIAVAALQRFWIHRGHITEAREWLGRALPSIDHLSEEQRGPVLLASGNLAWMAGDIPCARAHFSESLLSYRSRNDEEGIVKALGNLASIASQLQDYETARAEYEACLMVARRLTDVSLSAAILTNLGTICSQMRDFDSARARLEEALSLHAQLNNPLHKADLLHNLADLDLDQNETIRALRRLLESLQIRKRHGEQTQAPRALRLMGVAALALGYPGTAVRLLAAADMAQQSLGIVSTPHERENWSARLSAAQANLSREEFETEWSAGCSLAIDDAVAYAIDTAAAWLQSISDKGDNRNA